MRNIKRKDFDYYLTNLDWDDGSDIERDIKQFTRNDVFEHTYERPGFYSIKGLVFKYNELMINALPKAKLDMTDEYRENFRSISGHPLNSESYFGIANESTLYEDQINNVEVISKSPILDLQSEQLQLDLNNVDEDDRFVIRESFNRDTPVFIATPDVFGSVTPSGILGKLENQYGRFRENYRPWLENSIVAMIEHRPRTQELIDSAPTEFFKTKNPTSALPGICINLPIKMSFSENDHLQISLDLNLPNPNLEIEGGLESNYAVRVRMHPPKANGTTDWGVQYDDIVNVKGIGKSFQSISGRGKNDGWQTIKHISFAQPRDKIDSEGNDIPDSNPFDVVYIKVEIYPTGTTSLPQTTGTNNGHRRDDKHIYHNFNMEYIALRNISIKFPNTKGIVRPVEWQRFKSNMVVNPRINYESPLYEENKFAMIGGLSKDSSHFKTLASLISLDLDSDDYKDINLTSTYNEYDVLSMYDTMAKYDEKYYNEFLDSYTKKIHEDYAPYGKINTINPQNPTENEINESSLHGKPKITNGMIDRKSHGVFKDTSLIDVDIATTKVYTAVIPMWKQLGFENPIYDNPNNSNYWNNIIPKDYKLQNRTGITQRNLPNPQKGSLTPRIPRTEYVVDENVDQDWQGEYKWPVLPQLNKLGVFVSGSVDEPVYGGKTRWNQDDEVSKITNVFNDTDSNLKFNLNVSVDEIEQIQDIKSDLFLRYVSDWTLHLDEDKRISKNIIDIFDSIEKDVDRQAF